MDEILELLTYNASGEVTEETIDGKAYRVTNAVMLTEGVHEGSQGPVLYTAEEMKKDPSHWDRLPLLNGHPANDSEGNAVLANNNATVAEKQSLGFIDKTTFNGKLRTKLYFDKERVAKVEPRISLALDKEQPFEVSTGVVLKLKKQAGEWKGQKYKAVAENIRGDHLAVLMDSTGACSCKKGCGGNVHNESAPTLLVQNDASYSRIMNSIREQLNTKFGYSAYVTDVYDGFFVYAKDGNYSRTGTLYKRKYTVNKEGEVKLAEADPEAVKFVQEYRTVDGNKFVGNSSPETPKETTVDKKAKIDQLITNGSEFTEAERGWLDQQAEVMIDKLLSLSAKQPNKPAVPEKKATEPNPAITQNQGKTPTFDEDLARMSPQMRSFVTNALAKEKSEKDAVIASIIENQKDEPELYRQEWLAEQDTPTLKALNNSLVRKIEAAAQNTGGTNWRGAATVANAAFQPKPIEPMIPSKIDFSQNGK